jgi:hypothetical protein
MTDIIAQAEALIEEVRKIREDEPRIEIHASELSALERKALIRAADLAKRYEELMPQLLAEAKAWKVTAIEGRAKIEARRLIITYAEMLYAYDIEDGMRHWADMSDDRKHWIDRAEKELKEVGWI